MSGWDSLYDHEVSEELYQQVIRTNCKFPHTREQTIGVIKMLMAFGYTSVMAEIVAAEGLAPLFVARGCLVYRSIKEALRDKKTNVWHGLDEPATAPYMVTSEGEKYTYYDFLWYCMGDGDSVKRAMRKAETLRPEMLE